MDPSRALPWDEFRLVKVIADAKGLAGAAERLGVNHSTVFRRLGQLEANLGVKLFECHRTGYAVPLGSSPDEASIAPTSRTGGAPRGLCICTHRGLQPVAQSSNERKFWCIFRMNELVFPIALNS